MPFSMEQVYVLFRPWKIISEKGLAGSFVAVYAFALLNECLKFYNIYRTYTPSQTQRKVVRFTSRFRFHGMSTVLSTTELVVAYCLMLIAMTYNAWLFVALVLGSSTGYFVFTPLLTRYLCNKNESRHYEPVTAG